MDTGEILKEIRKKNNLTQGELADLLGVSNSMISKIESQFEPDIFIKYIYFCLDKKEDLNKIFLDSNFKKWKEEQKK